MNVLIKYYNGAGVLNAGMPINFCVGNRSTGKSYYWKRYAVRDYLRNGNQFIYVRRYQTDIDLVVDSYFKDIGKEPDLLPHKLELIDNTFYCDGQVMGNAISLSTAYKYKSVPHDNTNTIILDEFLPDNLQYLKPMRPTYEPEQILNLYMTVARGFNRPIRDEVKVICIANLVTLFNPYFAYFGIEPTGLGRFKNDGVYCEIFKNDEIAEEIRNSKIGRILERTTYGSYALDNAALLDSKRHIVKKLPAKVYVWFCLWFNDWYMCYIDDDDNIYFKKGYDKTAKNKYAVTPPEHDINIPLFTGTVLKAVRRYNDLDRIYYLSGEAKSNIGGIL